MLIAAKEAKLQQRDEEEKLFDEQIREDHKIHGLKIESLSGKLEVINFQLKALSVQKKEDID